MIMQGSKKHVLTQILGADPREKKEEEGGQPSSLHSCVSELIDAIHSKDVEGAANALRACVAECSSEEYGGE